MWYTELLGRAAATPAPSPALSPELASQNRGPELFVVSVAFVVVAVVLVGLRIWLRHKTQTLGADDIFIIVAAIASIIQSAAICQAIHFGFGKRFKTLEPDARVNSLLWFWITQLAYKFVTWPTKASLLLLYRRVLDVGGLKSWGVPFHLLNSAMLAIILFFWFACTIISIFACVPVARSWNKKIPGGCVKTTPWWFAYAAINISTDIIIFAIPLPIVKTLKLPRRARFALGGIFGLGLFVCITSIVRMTTLDTSSRAPDFTYDGVETLVWTIVESNVGIICACLPILRPLVARLFPKWLSKTSGFTSFDSNKAAGSKKNGYGPGSKKWTTSDNSNFAMTSIPGRRSHPPEPSNSQERIIDSTQDGIRKDTSIQVNFEASHDDLPPHAKTYQ